MTTKEKELVEIIKNLLYELEVISCDIPYTGQNKIMARAYAVLEELERE